MSSQAEESKLSRAPNSNRRMQRRLRMPASNFGIPTEHEDGEIEPAIDGIRRRLLIEPIESPESQPRVIPNSFNPDYTPDER